MILSFNTRIILKENLKIKTDLKQQWNNYFYLQLGRVAKKKTKQKNKPNVINNMKIDSNIQIYK